MVSDADGVDIGGGGLANRSTSASQRVTEDPPKPLDGLLSLVVSNSGNAKKGTLTMYYEGVAQP